MADTGHKGRSDRESDREKNPAGEGDAAVRHGSGAAAGVVRSRGRRIAGRAGDSHPGSRRSRGRDSLGRGLDEDCIAAVVAADRAVRREKEEIWFSLRHAYRDPYAAKAILDDMVKSRVGLARRRGSRGAPPLGRLLGRSGWFAGRGAELERAGAMGAARGVVHHLRRVGEAEVVAARTYRASVEAQRKADATPVPKLSARAEAAVTAIGGGPGRKTFARVCGARSRRTRR